MVCARARIALVFAFVAAGCADTGNDGADPGPEDGVRGDPAAFADIDGLIVRQALGPREGIFVLDPRTGAMSSPFLTEASIGVITGVAGSPDGLHVAVQSTQSLTVGVLGTSGEVPTFTEVFRRNIGAEGRPFIGFNRSGDWVLAAGRAVSVPDGEVIDCDGERADYAWASNDGRHVLLSCPGGRVAEGRVYRDGELAWLGDGAPAVGPYWNDTGSAGGRISDDGAWAGDLHLPSMTLVDRPESGTISDDLPVGSLTTDRSGRWVMFGGGSAGAFCHGSSPAAPLPPGTRTDWHGVLMDDASDPVLPLPFGGIGVLLDLPTDRGISIDFLGLDEDESHALFGGYVTTPVLEDDGVCRDRPVGEVRVRRMPIDGGTPSDGAFPLIELVSPLSETVPRDPWDLPTLFVAAAGDRVIAGGTFNLPGLIIDQDEARTTTWPATLLSPGRRATISVQQPPGDQLSIRVKAVCLERIDRADVGWCFDDGVAQSWEEMDFWGGWAAPGAGGFAGPAIYAATHEAAAPGTEVTLFGAGFGSSGTLRLGDTPISRTDIRTWSENRIVLVMPDDAPTEPVELIVDGGPDVFAHTIYRETANWSPTYDVPDHVALSAGVQTIPITPSPPDDARVTVITNLAGLGEGGFQLDPQVREAGFELTIPVALPAGAYRANIELGTETHQVVLDVSGELAPLGEEWQRLRLASAQANRTWKHVMFEGGDSIAVVSPSEGSVLRPDGTIAELVDDAPLFDGRWCFGDFDPFIVRDDYRMQQLTGFEGTPMATATWRDLPPLHDQIVQAIEGSGFPWAFAVDPASSVGLVGVVSEDDTCALGLCAEFWSFDLATGVPTRVADGVPVVSGLSDGLSADGNLRIIAGNDVLTFSSGALDSHRMLVGESSYEQWPTSWGSIGFDSVNHRAKVWVGDDAQSGVDLGLDDVVTVGTASDGRRALIGTASGEVFLLGQDAPTDLISLGAPPNWPHSDVNGLADTWLTVTRDGRVLWLIGSGASSLYQRALLD